MEAQSNHQTKLNTAKIKFDTMNFRLLLSKNPLIENQDVTSIRNLTPLAYPKILTYS